MPSPNGLAEIVADAQDILAERMEAALVEHPDIVTVTEGMRGWFSVHLKWSVEKDIGGFYEPEQSSPSSHATREEALEEAEWWAKDLGVKFVSGYYMVKYDVLGGAHEAGPYLHEEAKTHLQDIAGFEGVTHARLEPVEVV